MHTTPDDAQGAAATALPLTHINVDLNGLDDFQAFIARELDTNLRPSADTIMREHGQGVGFGMHNPGPQVRAARQRYEEILARSTANLAAYIDAAEILIAAMRKISHEYADADALAAAGANVVNAELAQAMAAASQARVAAAEAARVTEWTRRHDRIDEQGSW